MIIIKIQNNTKRTNYIKAKIDKIQQNRNCRLCGDRYETIRNIKSKSSKVVQKENKTRYD